jgi:HD domain-containing protein
MIKPLQTSDQFSDVFQFAETMHRQQVRKGTTVPYLSHVMAVSALVMENGGNLDQAIAALLHDVVEDCGGTPVLNEIRTHFGDTVANIVQECSDSILDTPTEIKAPWRIRKEEYIKSIASKSDNAMLVLLADKFHNSSALIRDLKRLGSQVWDRFNATPDESIWFYDEVAKAIQSRIQIPLVEDLIQNVEQLRYMKSAMDLGFDYVPDQRSTVKYSLYIGSRDGAAFTKADYTNLTALISDCFENFTIKDADGFYKGKPVCTKIIEIATTDFSSVIELAISLCKLMAQESVIVEASNVYHIVNQDKYIGTL